MVAVKNNVLYIAGPMRGHKRYNYEAFAKAQAELERKGWVVINPHAEDLKAGFNVFDLPEDNDWNEYPPDFDAKACRKRCFEAVEKCDCIFMLEGWNDSTGACGEHAHARWCDKHVAFQELAGYDCRSMEEDAGGDFPDTMEEAAEQVEEFFAAGGAPHQTAFGGWHLCPKCRKPVQNGGRCVRHPVLDSVLDEGEPVEAVTDCDQIFPDDDKERLDYPVFSGLLDYFPHACAEVAKHSKIGNDQHNPGEPMHWATEKSIGKGNKIVRHLMDGWRTAHSALRQKTIRHFAAMCWRALELLERYITKMPPFDKL